MWKPVKNYEGLYEVSDDGRVRSTKRRGSAGRELKPFNLKGYRRVSLSFKSKPIDYMVHRLVANAFIGNPDNLPHVNHIDGDKSNNIVSNLEWCSHLQNMHHAWRTGLMSNVGKNDAYVS